MDLFSRFPYKLSGIQNRKQCLSVFIVRLKHGSVMGFFKIDNEHLKELFQKIAVILRLY